jgi:hypothetical protein
VIRGGSKLKTAFLRRRGIRSERGIRAKEGNGVKLRK